MKGALIVAIGLIVGAAASAILNTGCCRTTGPVQSGTYGPRDPHGVDALPETDYRVTISADLKTVTETFTRASGSWEIVYVTDAKSP